MREGGIGWFQSSNVQNEEEKWRHTFTCYKLLIIRNTSFEGKAYNQLKMDLFAIVTSEVVFLPLSYGNIWTDLVNFSDFLRVFWKFNLYYSCTSTNKLLFCFFGTSSFNYCISNRLCRFHWSPKPHTCLIFNIVFLLCSRLLLTISSLLLLSFFSLFWSLFVCILSFFPKIPPPQEEQANTVGGKNQCFCFFFHFFSEWHWKNSRGHLGARKGRGK